MSQCPSITTTNYKHFNGPDWKTFLNDARKEIDNILVENAIRLTAVGKKN